MKILVCIRQGLDGEIGPFDAAAYEAALRVKGAEVTLISMGAMPTRDFLLRLTRLGAKRAVLLSDKAFAGADTVATAYALSLAVKKLEPDLVFCGRQTQIGDTAQTGPMLSVFSNMNLITNVMSIDEISESITCMTREEGIKSVSLPAVITVERINDLRLPSILSKQGDVEVWTAEDIGADKEKCGLVGSPTRVMATFENESGKRRCRFIEFRELDNIINEALLKETQKILSENKSEKRLPGVVIVGETPRKYAETVSDNIIVATDKTAEALTERIIELNPSAVLFGSDSASKELAAKTSALMGLGLCADCTALETDGEELIMYRPALSGSIVAKIRSLTKPAMATVRTNVQSNNVIVAAGFGAKDSLQKVKAFAERIGAEMVTSRKAVDYDVLPYSMQVGLTGKTVSPPVYIAVGVSGAVHHIVGMQQSGTVIAINPDKNAPIFDYADFGIIGRAEELL